MWLFFLFFVAGMTEYCSSITFRHVDGHATPGTPLDEGLMGRPALFTQVAVLASHRESDEPSRLGQRNSTTCAK